MNSTCCNLSLFAFHSPWLWASFPFHILLLSFCYFCCSFLSTSYGPPNNLKKQKAKKKTCHLSVSSSVHVLFSLLSYLQCNPNPVPKLSSEICLPIPHSPLVFPSFTPFLHQVWPPPTVEDSFVLKQLLLVWGQYGLSPDHPLATLVSGFPLS